MHFVSLAVDLRLGGIWLVVVEEMVVVPLRLPLRLRMLTPMVTLLMGSIRHFRSWSRYCTPLYSAPRHNFPIVNRDDKK